MVNKYIQIITIQNAAISPVEMYRILIPKKALKSWDSGLSNVFSELKSDNVPHEFICCGVCSLKIGLQIINYFKATRTHFKATRADFPDLDPATYPPKLIRPPWNLRNRLSSWRRVDSAQKRLKKFKKVRL